ncbi:MAG: 4-hydroxy-3-methylbut-2-en-1-yl diphosphate synthase, (E)-4-hydroxy-3-methylbut-2-enyl-diphosphate synthase [Candidatus Peregrinibacteria bacterium GW2011_GWC2_39_14]|nr:MAG: 4-hydroxy-3-methylbut-2-en-1-yl diphosphate synthase [Candidatus Peregrinibacteria bacterium GW2011_GWA2_38_36]KKR07112.1 MAG: 4-hydroxy-3-methylbut-2-en-1-yl diphosphate synthase, (E)-4-hydroxy-3-methylbut-2-enyl-diphosphate synthase [Candidatus Peregrinibacteria bacterium GW2011_GWC2_39_14]
MIQRRKTREVKIGGIKIGGKNEIAIQSMCSTKTVDVKKTVAQILALEKLGCEIIRIGIPDPDSAKAIKQIKKRIHIPLVADIHFDPNLAVASIENGADKIRINPSNIPQKSLVQIIEKAKKFNVPIRIGVNAGSIRPLKEKITAEDLVKEVKKQIKFFESLNFRNIVISLKHTDIFENIKAYEQISKFCDYPLHLGVTEAGTLFQGFAKNAIAISNLLMNGIGDTLRISLAEDPIEEIKAAKAILSSLNLYKKAPLFIVCPTCGRTNIDIIKISHILEEKLSHIKKPIKIAIMGCAVNGPGEVAQAKYGIIGGNKSAGIFNHGKLIKTVPEKEIVKEFIKLVEANEK